MPTAAQAQQHRAEVAALTTLAASQVGPVFAEFNAGEAIREALLDLLPALYALYGAAAATLSADWYDDLRETDGVRGRFIAIPADADSDSAGLEELVRWGVDPLFRAEPDPAAAQSLVEGGLRRRVSDVSRATLMESATADPAADGWQRVTSADACGFCRMLADRGLVFSEATVNFGAHDHCGCGVVPSWGGQPQPVKPYTKTRRNITAADRARTRKWMRENGYL